MEATHFIEQYQPIDKYRPNPFFDYSFTFCYPISYLRVQLEYTKQFETLETVAIFKIKLKMGAHDHTH